MASPGLAPIVLLDAEADLEDPDDVSLDDALAIIADLKPLLADEGLELETRARVLRAVLAALDLLARRLRELRGTMIVRLYEAGMSYPAIGERLGVTGERARQWALEAPSTTDPEGPQ